MEIQESVDRRLTRVEMAISEMRSHMADVDSIMTEQDYEDLLEYRKEKKEEKLLSHDAVKKELG